MTAVYNVLFLCTGNSARSILGEAVLNRIGEGRFRAYSAGSQPKDDVRPMTIEVLKSFGYLTDDLRSKNWNEFTGSDAPPRQHRRYGHAQKTGSDRAGRRRQFQSERS